MNGHQTSRARRLAALLLTLMPGVPIIAGLVIGAQSVASVIQPSGYVPTGALTAISQLTSDPPMLAGSEVAVLVRGTVMRWSPGGRPIGRVGTRTEFGSPEALSITSRVPGWIGVVSPLAGNGHLGWIPQAVASVSRVPWELKVSLSARKLTVIDAGTVIARYPVAVGRPSAPTPTGRFAVSDRLNTGDPTGPYGCCILALTAHAPHAIQGWNGGDRIAIHSTPDTASIGGAVSHGCVRLTLAEGRWLLDHIPLGTPTLIGA